LFKPGTVFCFYFCVGACCVEIKIFGSNPAVLKKMNCLQKIQDIFRTYNRGLIEGNGSLFLVAEIEKSNGNRTIDRLPHKCSCCFVTFLRYILSVRCYATHFHNTCTYQRSRFCVGRPDPLRHPISSLFFISFSSNSPTRIQPSMLMSFTRNCGNRKTPTILSANDRFWNCNSRFVVLPRKPYGMTNSVEFIS
jgi:hypothetical protein